MNVAIDNTEAVQHLHGINPKLVRRKGNGYMFDVDDFVFVSDYETRTEFIKLYGFAILDAETIRALAKYGPMIEVGAGTGYWAYELRKAGVDIIATDPFPVGANNFGFTKAWTEVEKLDAVTAVGKYPGRTLLTVWPDYRSIWSAECLKAYTGDTVIYVGEGDGGCTGSDEFHAILEADFDSVESLPIHQFFGIHDHLQAFKKKHGSD